MAVTKIAAWKEQEESGLNKTPSKKDRHNMHFFFRLRNFRVRIMHKTLVYKSLEILGDFEMQLRNFSTSWMMKKRSRKVN